MLAVFTKALLTAVFAASLFALSRAAPQAAQCASGVLSCCNLPSVLPGGFPECVFASPNAFPCPANAALACCDNVGLNCARL